MLISELEQKLKELREKHGDLLVYYTAALGSSFDGYEISAARYEDDVHHIDYESNSLNAMISNPGVILE